jgi:hypothetical protein
MTKGEEQIRSKLLIYQLPDYEFMRLVAQPAKLLATWVAHDLAHPGQISRVMAKQYREAVGPWGRYLGVMER